MIALKEVKDSFLYIFVFLDYKCGFFCKIKEIKGLGGGVL